MKQGITVFPGKYTLTFYDGNGNPSSVSTGNRNAGYDYVSNFSSVKGDKKKPTPFSYQVTYEKVYFGSEEVRYPDGRLIQREEGVLSGNGALSRAGDWFPPFTSYHYNRALDRLNDKVRGQLDLGVSVAEASQLKRMIASTNKLETYLGDFAKEAQRQRIKNAPALALPKLGKLMGAGWLTYQYGIRPLVQDVYGSIDEFYRSGIPLICQVEAKSHQRAPESVVLNDRWGGQIKDKAETSGITGVKFSLSFREKSGSFDLDRWTSLNPVSLAWELLTLSFVLDWVYNVGSALRSLETALLYDSQFVSGYYTELYAHSGSSRDCKVPAGGGNYPVDMKAFSDWRHITFNRVVLGSYPLPRMPTFKVQLGSERLLSAASLLAQHIR